SIAVDLPEPQELRILQPRNQPQNALLLGKPQMILKTDQVIAIRPQILLTQLDRRPRPAPRNLLDGQARLEIRHVIRYMRFHRLRRQQLIDEPLILRLVHRTIQIVARHSERFVIARSRKRYPAVDRGSIHDRADAVVKIQPSRSSQPPDIRSQPMACQRTSRNNRGPQRVYLAELLAPDLNPRMRFDRRRDLRGK